MISIDQQGNTKILSLGHRNQQGLAIFNDKIFISEHGPMGGDEINLISNKKDHYGWPFFANGFDYRGTIKYRFPHSNDFKKPLFYFTPSIE